MEEIDDLPQTKSFSQITKKDGDTVLIVDALNLAFRYLHSGKRNFWQEYLATVESLASSYKAGTVIIAADHGSSFFRKSIFPAYKQNRKDKFELQTEEEKEKFNLFFQDFEFMLEQIPKSWKLFRFSNVEADDIAAYIVLLDKYSKVWLISSDKDWDLLVSDKVSRFSYVTRKETTAENWSEHYDCSIENYIGLKCLQGDPGDNIKGVTGIGPKRATQLLEEYGDIFNLIDAIPIPGKQKFIQELNTSKDLLFMNHQLMDLLTYCDEALGTENIQYIKENLC